jgi:UDP-2-acetamido-3-amino-2,3-dideoxy-glucuronate N-acetyltransferase
MGIDGFKREWACQTSFVHPEAKVGRATIWGCCYVGKATIGKSTIGHGCVIHNNVVIGDGCKMQSLCDVSPKVTIEDDVFIGAQVQFANDRAPRAFAGKGLDGWMPTLVKKGASIGNQSTLVPGITIGEYAAVAAGSVVTKDVPPYTLVRGNPAVQVRAVSPCNQWHLPSECKCDLPPDLCSVLDEAKEAELCRSLTSMPVG